MGNTGIIKVDCYLITDSCEVISRQLVHHGKRVLFCNKSSSLQIVVYFQCYPGILTILHNEDGYGKLAFHTSNSFGPGGLLFGLV